MKMHQRGNSSWPDIVSGMVGTSDSRHAMGERLDSCCDRVKIVSRIRWIVLGVLALYAVVAAVCFSCSQSGFSFSLVHVSILSLTVIAGSVYNYLIGLRCSYQVHFPYLTQFQIIFDLLLVTILIHYTGGVFSWFWPVYLLITLESAFLCEDVRDVWIVGALGACFYGALLVAEGTQFVAVVPMPFVNSSQQFNFLFQLLMWCWVFAMNASVALIAVYLMGAVRKDHVRLKESEDALLNFIATAHDLIFCVDRSGTLLYTNRMFVELLSGENQAGIHTHSIYEFIDSDARAQLSDLIDKVLDVSRAAHMEASFLTFEKLSVDVEMSLTSSEQSNGTSVVWVVCRDISERKRTQNALYSLAHHDILTGLPNRVLLEDRLVQAKALANRQNSGFALLFLDIDRFKIINDTLGHSTGDELLRMVASRLLNTLRETDTVARIGGDEFIVLLADTGSRQDVMLSADKIMKSLALPFTLRDHELFVTTSLGGCMYPEDDSDTESMMKKADIAMYHAKGLGRNNFQFYDIRMDQNASRRFVISNSLRKGLERGEFHLLYQPKISVSTGQIIAMEALVRWEHPELGVLLPLEFIQLAEENGSIVQLGEWVLKEACRQNVQWRNDGLANLRVAVNISGYQLQHASLLTSLENIIAETGIAPENLEFEITERVIMQSPESLVGILSAINELGIHISIDDFGNGYSMLTHLKRFSVNTLKIDKSFIHDVYLGGADAAIAAAIISMGTSMNLNVIAEGVENKAQFDYLKEIKCGQVQGFLFSHPLPPDEFIKLLKQEGQSA